MKKIARRMVAITNIVGDGRPKGEAFGSCALLDGSKDGLESDVCSLSFELGGLGRSIDMTKNGYVRYVLLQVS